MKILLEVTQDGLYFAPRQHFEQVQNAMAAKQGKLEMPLAFLDPRVQI